MEPSTLEQVLSAVAALAIAVITGFVIPLIRKQAQVADAKLTQQQRDALYPALQYAVDFARGLVGNDSALKEASAEKQKAHVVNVAAGYVRSKLPDTLDKLGVTDEALKEMLSARLQTSLDYLKIPASK